MHDNHTMVAADYDTATRLFTKDELPRDVGDFRSPGGTRPPNAHARRLGPKLAAVAGNRFVVNVCDVGYRLVDSASASLGRAA